MKQKMLGKKVVALAIGMVMFCAMKIPALADGVLNLKQIGANETSLHIAWDKELDCTYAVDICENKDFSGTVKNVSKNQSNAESLVNDLDEGKLYYVRVVSSSGKSQIISVATNPGSFGYTEGPDQDYAETGIDYAGIKWPKREKADGYNIYCNDVLVKTVEGANVTVTRVNQEPGKSKTYYVKPFKKSEAGYIAEAKGGSVPIWTAPLAPIECEAKWKPSSNSLRLDWETDTNNEISHSGFQVEIYSLDGTKLEKDAIVYNPGYLQKGESFTVKAIKNKGCQYRVRGYFERNDVKVFGQWSEMQPVVPMANVVLKKGKGKTVKASWSKIAKATGYEVYVATGKSNDGTKAKFKKVASTKKNSYVIKNVKAKKYTMVYVVAKVKVGDKTFKSIVNKEYCASIK